jgi:hypothetical protein
MLPSFLSSLSRLLGLLTVVSLVMAPGCAAGDDGDPGAGSADVTTSAIPNKDAFWAEDMFFIRINGWDPNKMTPASMDAEQRVGGAELLVYKTKATSSAHCPDNEVQTSDLVYKTQTFSVRTSGNMTKDTPKSSYKLSLDAGDDRLFAMKALNLKSMWNDASQMREGLAWKMFAAAGVPAPHHTYAKFCINAKYYGLYSLIEQVEETFLQDRYGTKDGNLFKAYWMPDDVGPSDLTYRKQGTDDSGKQYFVKSDMDSRSYRLKAGKDATRNTYDDLATFIRVLNGVTTPDGASKFDTPAFKAEIEKVFDVKTFLRWASLNMLLGAWDNYYATPANYYLYNAGHSGAAQNLMNAPYFTWIPWDYDNSFGHDFFNTKWQFNDIVDWEAGTLNYYQGKKTASLPLVKNLLSNQDYLRYYLDSIEFLVDQVFNETALMAMIGTPNGPGLRARAQSAALLEADGPDVAPHTGRQWTNNEVLNNGFGFNEIQRGSFHADGVLHYVRMRHDNVKDQLAKLRQRFPKGSSGATFPAKPEVAR